MWLPSVPYGYYRWPHCVSCLRAGFGRARTFTASARTRCHTPCSLLCARPAARSASPPSSYRHNRADPKPRSSLSHSCPKRTTSPLAVLLSPYPPLSARVRARELLLSGCPHTRPCPPESAARFPILTQSGMFQAGTIPSGRRHVNRSRWQSGEAQSRPCRNFRCSRTRPGSTRSGRRPRPEDAELKASRTTTTGIDSAKNLAWTERTGRPTGARPYRRTASSRARQASYSKPRPFDILIDGWAFCGNDPERPACTRRARPHLAAPANRRHTPTCKCQQPHACPEPGVMLPTRSGTTFRREAYQTLC